MIAVGYVRVSTDHQADGGESLDVQRNKVTAMAEVQGAELVELIEDAAESAKDLRRPGMSHLLEMVDAGAVDIVIVHKLDRLTRSVRDLGDLLDRFERRGVALVSVNESLDTGTAAGRLVLNIMGAVSQWEREAIAERTRDALQSKKAKGERVGTVPFGFTVARDGVRLLADDCEQAVLALARDLRAAGESLRAIARHLNRKGMTTRSGSAWRHEYVRNILRAA